MITLSLRIEKIIKFESNKELQISQRRILSRLCGILFHHEIFYEIKHSFFFKKLRLHL